MKQADGRLEAAAERLKTMLTWLFVIVAAAVVGERAGYAGLYRGEGSGRALAEQLVLALPAIAYLTGVWQLRRGVAALGAGELFGPSLASALRRVGLLVVAGALLSLFAVPAAQQLLESRQPRSIDVDVGSLVLAALGLALAFFARLLERASVLQQELDEIF